MQKQTTNQTLVRVPEMDIQKTEIDSTESYFEKTFTAVDYWALSKKFNYKTKRRKLII